jgi:coenzyme F420-dependent glucose-6-phosphate dehydrogenase
VGWRAYRHRGKQYIVETARIYDLPEEPPPIMVAVSGKRSTSLAASISDGMITSSLMPEAVSNFENMGGGQKPRYGRFEVCWMQDEKEARRMAYQFWRSTAIKGQAKTELALPAYFEQLAMMLKEEDIAEQIVCGPEPGPHIEKFKSFAEAGYTHVSAHQVIPEQEGFFRFYKHEVLPELSRMGLTVATGRTAVAGS